MLGGHPAILAHPDEPQFLLGLYQRFGLTIRNVSEAIRYLASHPYFPLTLDKQRIQDTFQRTEYVSLADFIQTYLALWCDGSGPLKALILKHPELVYNLDFVEAVFDNPVIIHIVRDPRANVFSQRTRWPKLSVWECAVRWKTAVRTARTWGERNKRSYHEVRFKDLVTRPKSSLETLLAALDIPFSDNVLRFEHQSTVYKQNQPNQIVKYTATDPSKIDYWQHKLSNEDMRLIEMCCRIEMKWWGYAPENPQVSSRAISRRIWVEQNGYRLKQIGRAGKAFARKIGWRTGWISRAV